MDNPLGKVTEKLGWATADREMEAKGKLKQLAHNPDATDDDATAAQAVEDATLDVRSEHGELAPGAEPDR